MVKVELDGVVKLRSTASDAPTLGNVHFNIIDLGGFEMPEEAKPEGDEGDEDEKKAEDEDMAEGA